MPGSSYGDIGLTSITLGARPHLSFNDGSAFVIKVILFPEPGDYQRSADGQCERSSGDYNLDYKVVRTSLGVSLA